MVMRARTAEHVQKFDYRCKRFHEPLHGLAQAISAYHNSSYQRTPPGPRNSVACPDGSVSPNGAKNATCITCPVDKPPNADKSACGNGALTLAGLARGSK